MIYEVTFQIGQKFFQFDWAFLSDEHAIKSAAGRVAKSFVAFPEWIRVRRYGRSGKFVVHEA